ncbi:MAG: cation-translocating P-type ATPase [Nitrospiraceae bacterium]|nr:cation-translocating P-type ATPase [Nitrospiraceae bacterium]
MQQKNITLRLEGLDCASCAEKIQKHLLRMSGIQDVQIYLSTSKAAVTFNPKATDRETVINAIESIGYKAYEHDDQTHKSCRCEQMPRILLVLFFIALGIAGAARDLQKELLGIESLWDVLAVLIGGYPLLKKAFADIKDRNITAEVFMSLGMTAAFAIGEFRSAAIIALFMLIAEYIDSFTMEKSRRAIKQLIDGAPKTARVKKGGAEIIMPVDQVQKDDLVVVAAGEQIPVEGIVVSGSSCVNQATITGESMPVDKKEGDFVYAATINQDSVLFIKTLHTSKDTTYARIIKLVEEAEASKAPVQKVADRFASYFTPAVLGVTGLTLVFTGSLLNAISVLVVACPCAIAIATPLAVVAGMGRAAQRGIIIKGGKHLESLAKVNTLVVDKTGTLTIGRPVVTDIRGFCIYAAEDIISYAAALERYSEHPLAKAVMTKAHELSTAIPEPQDIRVHHGMGIEAVVNGDSVLMGSRELLANRNIVITGHAEKFINTSEQQGRTALILSINNAVCGVIVVADTIRDEALHAINELKKLGLDDSIMLTGDNPRAAASVAAALDIGDVRAQMLPQQKLAAVKELISSGKKVLMVGDGINDAPALAQADIGIAMGAIGSDAAIEASDVALMRDDWAQIPQAVRISRMTFSIIRQNIAIGICFNIIGMTLASTGLLNPQAAAVAHVLPDMLVFLNSSRILNK